MILDMRDQLGNQLFSYASIKSVCKELGQKFAFVSNDTVIVNSSDKKYGNTLIGGAFPNIDLTEKAEFVKIPEYNWKEPAKRDTNFLPEVYKLSENDFILGHFQCEKYFSKYKDEVCNWFKLNDDIENYAKSKFEEIKKSGKVTVSIHFRRADDYKKQGRLIDDEYYFKALERLLKLINKSKEDIIAVLFYDTDPGEKVKSRLGCEIYERGGTLFQDLALMKLCDHHIVSNSTFAWWAAWLDRKADATVLRPSVYPVSFAKLYPDDIYPDNWIKVDANRGYSLPYYVYGVLIEYLKLCIKRLFLIMRGITE